MLDIDHFKHFNDRYGHMAGDDCLRIVASIVAATASRGGDFAARFGGEEFVVLLPGTDVAGAKILAERIRSLTEERAIAHAGGKLGARGDAVGGYRSGDSERALQLSANPD